MSALVLFKRKYLQSVFLHFLVFFIFGANSELKGACRGEGFMGISSNDPIMSWVDLTYSPVYTSASTSGTSGCKNWDFTFEEYVLHQFLEKSHNQILVEAVKGKGIHIEALSMMTCPDSSSKMFADMLYKHRQKTLHIFKTAKQTRAFLDQLRKWIRDYPDLHRSCFLS